MDARKETPDVMENGQDKSNRYKRSFSEGPDDKKKLLPERRNFDRCQSEGNPKSTSSLAADLEKKERVERRNSRSKSIGKSLRLFSVSPSAPIKANEKNDSNSTKYTSLK